MSKLYHIIKVKIIFSYAFCIQLKISKSQKNLLIFLININAFFEKKNVDYKINYENNRID